MEQIDSVLDYIREHPQSSAAVIGSELKISRRSIFRCLKELVREGKISKIGQAPHLTYALPGVVPADAKTKVADPAASELPSDQSRHVPEAVVEENRG